MKKLETLFFNFIWKGKIDRVSRKILIQNYDLGGLKMVNIQFFIKSLKCTRFRKLLNSSGESSWKQFVLDYLPSSFSNCLQYGNFYYNFVSKKIRNPFWKDVFKAVFELSEIIYKDRKLEFQPYGITVALK